MFLPSALVAALLALHLRIVYGAVKHVQVEPSVISTTIWVLAELLLPHAVHYYMLKTVQRRDGVLGPAGHSPAAGSVARASAEVATEQAASCAKVPPELCGQVGPSSSSPGKEAAAVSTRQTAQAPDENLVAAETTAEAGHGLVSAAQDTGSGHAMLPSEAGVTVDDDSKGLLQQVCCQRRLVSRKVAVAPPRPITCECKAHPICIPKTTMHCCCCHAPPHAALYQHWGAPNTRRASGTGERQSHGTCILAATVPLPSGTASGTAFSLLWYRLLEYRVA
jgi:hypothetical protein